MWSPQKIRLLLTVSISWLSLVACDRSIYDDLSHCPQGMEFSFVSQTPCMDVLPLDRMTGLMLQIYDERGILVKEYDEKSIRITPDFKFSIPFAIPGRYTFSFWGMESRQTYTKGLLFSCGLPPLTSVVSEALPALFYGSIQSHKIVDRSDMGTVIESFEINMLPYTHNFNIEVMGLLDQKDYTVVIESNNATYDRYGKSLKTPVSYVRESKSIGGKINVSMNTLRQERIGISTIHIKNSLTGQNLLSVSLDSILHLIESQSGEKVNLDCIQDLNLKLEVITHQTIRVTLNEWNLVYRTVILD